MLAGDKPGRRAHLPTLVAMVTRSRLPLRRSQRPRIRSDSPPSLPGAQYEYESAVSTRSKPASTNASSSANEVASSALQPNTLPPKASGAIESGERPSGALGHGRIGRYRVNARAA